MTPKKPEVKETQHEHVAASAVPDGGGAGTPAPEEGAPAASEAAAPEDGAPAAADSGLGVQPVADAGDVTQADHEAAVDGMVGLEVTPVVQDAPAEKSSWDRLAQRTAL